MNTKIMRIGTRNSVLAKAQAQIVADHIKRCDNAVEIEIVPIKTKGDILLDQPLELIGGKGVFVRELDAALLNGSVDLCVHCLKDMPQEETPGICIAAVSSREDPRDVLIFPDDMKEQPPDRPIGTSSLRRKIQLQTLFPGCRVEPVRGNILTRLEKLDRGEYGALVLAAAGLLRLGLEKRIFRYFSVEEMIPACGQGILAVTARDGEAFPCLAKFHDAESWDIAQCELAFIKTVGGGCTSPITAYALIQEDQLVITGYTITKENKIVPGSVTGPRTEAAYLGVQLGDYLMREAEAGE